MSRFNAFVRSEASRRADAAREALAKAVAELEGVAVPPPLMLCRTPSLDMRAWTPTEPKQLLGLRIRCSRMQPAEILSSIGCQMRHTCRRRYRLHNLWLCPTISKS